MGLLDHDVVALRRYEMRDATDRRHATNYRTKVLGQRRNSKSPLFQHPKLLSQRVLQRFDHVSLTNQGVAWGLDAAVPNVTLPSPF
jgi:hypothetical protein